MEERNDDATAMFHAGVKLAETLGMHGVVAGPERAIAELDWAPELVTAGGQQLHGGAIMALAESSGSICAFMALPEGSVGTSTIEFKINFLGKVLKGDTVRATSEPLHVGKSTIVIETDLTVGDRLVGKVTQTLLVWHPRTERTKPVPG